MRHATPHILVLLLLASADPAAALERKAVYSEAVLADQPVAWWRFNDAEAARATNHPGLNTDLKSSLGGKVVLTASGPRPATFPDFEGENTAASFDGKGSSIRVQDPGAKSPLDFTNGDAITLEAWVNLKSISEGQNIYIVGKGRTGNKDVAQHNQNYALRLRALDRLGRPSFVFRDAKATDEKGWHRWTTDVGFAENSGWHYIAISYVFGQSGSARGFIDGTEVKGRWDMGGPTDAAPVVDDDELWIGSSMGGSPASSFNGLIDEVAIYRSALNPETLRKRYRHVEGSKLTFNDGAIDEIPSVAAAPPKEKEKEKITPVESAQKVLMPVLAELPKAAVRVELFENLGKTTKETLWEFGAAQLSESYKEKAFGFSTYPKKYNPKGIQIDRSAPFAMRASAAITLPAGQYKLLLRAKTAARLIIDGTVLATTPQPNANASGHDAVAEVAAPVSTGTRPIQPGHYERLATFTATGAPQIVMVETIVGASKLRPEIGELTVSATPLDSATKETLFVLLSPAAVNVPLTDDGWIPYAQTQTRTHEQADAVRRKAGSRLETDYWGLRHVNARRYIATLPPLAIPRIDAIAVGNDVDRFILSKLDAAKASPTPLSDDLTFIRRVTLDVTGLTPTPEQVAAFLNDKTPFMKRRARLIDRLLDDPGWAEHWVGYWQDVLAENPGLLKPQLNNTGPFRWWIRESFADNKPMDRFATELVMMEGSFYGGSPAGFAMASQNDAPMAEKAHIVGKAFLATEMKCARCHDAPHHDFKQEQLFSMAAMLRRAPQEVPKTSSIPLSDHELRRLEVTVSLKPGAKISPAWPFAELMPGTGDVSKLAPEVLRKKDDTREQLAALMTAPENERFAQVLANRVWKRYMGFGIVEPVDDWETFKPSHPELLKYLGREMTANGFSLKHVARLILNSHTYQRAAHPDALKPVDSHERLFASQTRRRMSAEQVVDSLFVAAGKDLNVEQLNFDIDGRRPFEEFQNLGMPKRAWELSSLSNERDRPALALPVAQSVTDVLSRFGWRESRQAPITVRDESTNVLQPAILANGTVGGRAVRLSDDSALTELSLKEQPLPELIRAVFLRVLTREPSASEQSMFESLLSEGHSQRVVNAPIRKSAAAEAAAKLAQVSWSNHLSPEATKIKMELEKAARDGDPPTNRLKTEWRERMEDFVWSLVNSPEFIFIP